MQLTSPQYTGLTAQEVADSRRQYGSNVLTPPRRRSMWSLYIEKYKDPIIVILLVAAVVSLALAAVKGDYLETIGIFLAIFFATTVGFYFERDASRKFRLLTLLNEQQPVKVRRDGEVMLIGRQDVVVGDIVLISVGDEIPADGVLLSAINLQIDESTLTGEPLTTKHVGAAADDKAERSDHASTYAPDFVLRSTMVMNGNGVFRVTAVGDQTEIGHVAMSSTAVTGVKTPLVLQLEQLAKRISKWGGAFSILSFFAFLVHHILVNPALWHSDDYFGMAAVTLKYFMMAVTLIVMAVPEGLPMAITLALALNMRRMLKSNILVRTLNACETMGAVNIICTDKTGTLTQNRMQVHEMFEEQPNKRDLLQTAIAVNSTAELNGRQVIGNPTEGALLLWLQACAVDYRQLRQSATLIAQEPFSTEKKYMTTTVEINARRFLFMKGAPEIVMARCQLSADRQSALSSQLLAYQQKGYRTLAFACAALSDQSSAVTAQDEKFTFQGFCAIEDPVRSDVPAAVEQCRQAGIEVKIVTGDTVATASEIARAIGIWNGATITGEAFAALSDDDARQVAKDICLMARARPSDKQRLVSLLQQTGAVVAVTGDGTNDAPALHHAQVGLSLGSGTNVAKESSDMTLIDDSFASIVNAVMWGRSLYKNIQRFLFFQLVVNATALLLVLVGSIVGNEMPLTVTQILWVNLIMDTFAAMALASLPPTRAVLDEQPRNPQAFIISADIAKNILASAILFFTIMFAFLLYCERNGQSGINLRELTQFFTTFVMLQFWNLFNAKVLGTYQSAFRRLWASKGFLLIAVAILFGQWLIVEFGGEIFRTTPLPLADWAVIVVGTSVVLWLGELKRLISRHFHTDNR